MAGAAAVAAFLPVSFPLLTIASESFLVLLVSFLAVVGSPLVAAVALVSFCRVVSPLPAYFTLKASMARCQPLA